MYLCTPFPCVCRIKAVLLHSVLIRHHSSDQVSTCFTIKERKEKLFMKELKGGLDLNTPQVWVSWIQIVVCLSLSHYVHFLVPYQLGAIYACSALIIGCHLWEVFYMKRNSRHAWHHTVSAILCALLFTGLFFCPVFSTSKYLGLAITIELAIALYVLNFGKEVDTNRYSANSHLLYVINYLPLLDNVFTLS